MLNVRYFHVYVMWSNLYKCIFMVHYFFDMVIVDLEDNYLSKNFIKCGYLFETFLESVIESILTIWSKVHDSFYW